MRPAHNWSGPYQKRTRGRVSVTFLRSRGTWALRLDGEIIARHNSRAAAMREGSAIARRLELGMPLP